MPGPLVVVSARAPAQPAPITMPIAASSSSAWTIAQVVLPVVGSRRYFSARSVNDSARLDDGVIGYQVSTVAPANSAPTAAAKFPSTRILPAVLSMRATPTRAFTLRLALAQVTPAWTASRFTV